MPPKIEPRQQVLANDRGWFSNFGLEWSRFWFSAVDPSGFHGVRVLVGTLVLIWLVSFMGYQEELFGMSGVFDARAYQETSRMPVESTPLVGWSPLYALRTPTAVNLFYGGSILAAVLFTVGVATRLTAPLVWVSVVGFTSNPALWYGGDALLLMLTFYMMAGYLLDGLDKIRQSPLAIFGDMEAPIWRMIGSKNEEDREARSVVANLTLRLLQVHLAVILFATGTHKLQMAVWWSGAGLWFPLNPPLETTLASILAKYSSPDLFMSVLSLATYLMMLWQIGFVFFAWRPSWRPLVVLGGLLGWIGCALIFRMPLFGPTIFIGTLAFLPAAQWRAALDWVARKVGSNSTPELESRVETRLESAPIESAPARPQHVA